MKKVIIGLGVIILLIILVGMFKFNILSNLDGYNVDGNKTEISKIELPPENMVVCTQEVKQCPDGSFVGRTGPKCEFAKCSNK